MRWNLALLLVLVPAFANAGVTYELTRVPLTPDTEKGSAIPFIMEGDLVRIGPTIYKAGTVYILDDEHKSVAVWRDDALAARREAGEKLLQRLPDVNDPTIAATADQRAAMAKGAAAMRAFFLGIN